MSQLQVADKVKAGMKLASMSKLQVGLLTNREEIGCILPSKSHVHRREKRCKGSH